MTAEPLTLVQKLRYTSAVLIVILVGVLFFQNREPVTTNFLLWSPEMPRFILLGTVFVVGALARYLVGRGFGRR